MHSNVPESAGNAEIRLGILHLSHVNRILIAVLVLALTFMITFSTCGFAGRAFAASSDQGVINASSSENEGDPVGDEDTPDGSSGGSDTNTDTDDESGDGTNTNTDDTDIVVGEDPKDEDPKEEDPKEEDPKEESTPEEGTTSRANEGTPQPGSPILTVDAARGIGSNAVLLNPSTQTTDGKSCYGTLQYGYSTIPGDGRPSDDPNVPGHWQEMTYDVDFPFIQFTGLNPDSTYYFFARYTGGMYNGIDWAPAVSEAVSVTTRANTTYLVKVMGSSASPNGTGYYIPGVSVSIYATSAGYEFRSWSTESEDVTFDNRTSRNTSFKMPSHDVTVTAGWSGAVINGTDIDNDLKIDIVNQYGNVISSGIDLAYDIFGKTGGIIDRILGTPATAGDSVKVWVEAKEDGTLTTQQKQLMGVAATSDYTIVRYEDITLWYQFVSGTEKEKHNPDMPLPTAITIGMNLPSSIPELKSGYERSYRIVRLHDGRAEVLNDVEIKTINGTKRLLFKSDKFSAFAIAYKDTKTGSDPSNPDNPNDPNKPNNSDDPYDLGDLDYDVPGGSGSGDGSSAPDMSGTDDAQPAPGIMLILFLCVGLAVRRIRVRA